MEETSAKHDSGSLAGALLSSSLTAALENAPDNDGPGTHRDNVGLSLPDTPFSVVNADSRQERSYIMNTTPLSANTSSRKKKVIFCKQDGCQSYARERGFCIKHGGGKRCLKDGCGTRCYALGFCFKHGSEAYNLSEFEEQQPLKKAKCSRCTKVFEAPVCFFSTLSNFKCNNLVHGNDSKAFCEVHARQLLVAAQEQTINGLEKFVIPNMADTKNLRKSTCYTNKKKPCSVEGCKSLARKNGKCQKHAMKAECAAEGCSGKAQSRGLCGHHGGGKRCKFSKCFKVTRIGSKYCARHASNETEEEADVGMKRDVLLPEIRLGI